MAASNPYASAGSPRGYDAPKKKRNKWLWIGLPILLLIIIGAVLGGVLGTQLNKGDNSSSSSSGNSNSNNAANTGVPSGVSNVNTATSTGINGERYLAIATNVNSMPVYATGVSH
jgi:flagellar basal body-associated protein FliL